MPTETNDDREDTNGGNVEDTNINGDSDNNNEVTGRRKRSRSKPKRYQTDEEEEEAQPKKKQYNKKGSTKQPPKKKQYKKKGSTTKQSTKKQRNRKKCSYTNPDTKEKCECYAQCNRVCTKHGANRKKCSYTNPDTKEQCKSIAKNNGVCVKHGANRKKCSYKNPDTGEQCKSNVINNGVCLKHGAKKRKKCSYTNPDTGEQCKSNAINNGVCVKHGAKKRICSIEGCTNGVCYREGVCRKHHKNRNACNKNRCQRNSVEDADGFCNIHSVSGERCNYNVKGRGICGDYTIGGTGRCCKHPQCTEIIEGIQCTSLGCQRDKKCRRHADEEYLMPKEKINVHKDGIAFKLKSARVKDEYINNKKTKDYFGQVIVAIINLENSNGSSYEEIKQYIETNWRRKNGEFVPYRIELALLDCLKMNFIITVEKEVSAIEKLMDEAALCKPVEEASPAADKVSTNKSAETATRPVVDGESTKKNVDESTPTQYDTLKSNLRSQIESKQREEIELEEKIHKEYTDKDRVVSFQTQLKACREQLRVLIDKANELEETAGQQQEPQQDPEPVEWEEV